MKANLRKAWWQRTKYFPLFGLLGCVQLLSLQTVHGAFVSYWRFETNDFTADSSGNGHTLVNSGAAASTDKTIWAPGDGSALLDGSADFLKTLSALNLSSYPNLTVQWFMKPSSSAVQMIWEHGDVAAGAVPGQVGAFIPGTDRASLLLRQSGDTVQYGQNYSAGSWHHFAVTIQTNAIVGSRYHFYVDYSEVGSGFTSSGNGTEPAFVNDIFFIGARSGSSLFFGGNIDELAISNEVLLPSQFIPEPSSTVLLLSMLGVLYFARRTQP